MHPALALQQAGVWHALSLSACQQVIGPLRACVDLRFAMDLGTLPGQSHSAAAGGAAERRQQLSERMSSMRPSLVEVSQGAAAVMIL